jgi:hypothetical protein
MGQQVQDAALDGASQGTGAIGGFVAFVGQQLMDWESIARWLTQAGQRLIKKDLELVHGDLDGDEGTADLRVRLAIPTEAAV